MKHHDQIVDFLNLNFKAIDIEVLADETKEKEGEGINVVVVGGDGASVSGPMDDGHVEEVVIAP